MIEQGKKGKLCVVDGNLCFVADGDDPVVIAAAAPPPSPPTLARKAWARASLATRAAWAALRGRNVEVDAKEW